MVASLNQTFSCEGNTHEPSAGDIVKTFIIIIVMILIIIGNVCCLIVFNMPRSRKHFMKRVRYTMNSLCCTDLSMGLLVCPSTIYPALYQCWPFGEGFCKIEALLLSALFHESTLNMVLIAVDRYFVIHYSQKYNSIMTTRRYLGVILSTWIVVFSTYAVVIFAGEQFYYDRIGINCEPYYENADVTLSVISIFYFVPAIIFVFCYGSIYRTATQRKILTVSADDKNARLVNANIRTAKYLAAITLGFFTAVSPWTLCTLIIVAAKIKLNETVDYMVTWLAISNSFWNCLIYSATNRKFRMAAARFACGRWIASLKETTTSKGDESNYSEDSSAYSKYKLRLSKRVSNKNANHHLDVTATSSAVSSLANSPAHTPQIAKKNPESGVTDIS